MSARADHRRTVVMRIRTLSLGFAMVALALTGCAKPDWIQQTLVTVDVTGTWQTTEGGLIELLLLQEGPKVRGFMRMEGTLGNSRAQIRGPIEGSVTGDVFSFKQANVSDVRSEVEMLVSGDEMSGDIRRFAISPSNRPRVLLRRTDSSRPSLKP